MKRQDSYSQLHLVGTQGFAFDDEDDVRLGDVQQRKGRTNSQQTRAHMRDIHKKRVSIQTSQNVYQQEVVQ